VAQVQVDGQTVRVDEKKPLYMLRGGRGGRFGDGGRGGGRFDGGRGYYGRGGPGGRGGPVMPGRGPGRGERHSLLIIWLPSIASRKQF
jgi:hypothetical protein